MNGRERGATPCPIARAADAVGDRWTLMIMRQAMVGTTRFDAFRGALGIADNVLSNRLGRLVENGLMTKVPYRDTGRTRHEYRLTPAGADLLPVLNALAAWGTRHTEAPEPGPGMRVVHTACGGDLATGEYCAACGRVVPREEIRWVLPWREGEPRPLADPVEPADAA